jgi:hypothetical protein
MLIAVCRRGDLRAILTAPNFERRPRGHTSRLIRSAGHTLLNDQKPHRDVRVEMRLPEIAARLHTGFVTAAMPDGNCRTLRLQPGDRVAMIHMVRAIELVGPGHRPGQTERFVDGSGHVLWFLRIGFRIATDFV